MAGKAGKVAVKKFHESLLRDILSMLDKSDDYDVIIRVDHEQFFAHSSILKARSAYFKNVLTERVNKKDKLVIEFKKPNVDSTVFKIILNYIYTGKMCLTNKSGEVILGLMVASEELRFGLSIMLQDYIIKYQSPWILQNLDLVLHTVSKFPDYKKLQDYCIQAILEDPQTFITSKNFLSLDEDILHNLLKRDDLLIEEIVVWDNLIKWGLEKTGLRSEITDWSNEDYEKLKNILSQLIDLIRFSEISSRDFYEKVRPFKVIIPDNIYENIMKFYMKVPEDITILPPRIGTMDIESRIIKPKLAYVIANWIEGKDAKSIRNKKCLKYKFELLYRSSRDSFRISALYNQCRDDQGPYLILITKKERQEISQTSKNLTKIYGEYNSFKFNSNRLYSTSKSFIFSFENNND